jgi:hypothetical protein
MMGPRSQRAWNFGPGYLSFQVATGQSKKDWRTQLCAVAQKHFGWNHWNGLFERIRYSRTRFLPEDCRSRNHWRLIRVPVRVIPWFALR